MKNGESNLKLDEERKRVAVLLALRTGLLRKCPQHGEIYDPGQHDYQGASMVASYLINNGDPLVAPFLGERAPLMELLRSICPTYGSACPQCSKPSSG
jgi:hypothetical protein